jgi:hypothetical protein
VTVNCCDCINYDFQLTLQGAIMLKHLASAIIGWDATTIKLIVYVASYVTRCCVSTTYFLQVHPAFVFDTISGGAISV